MNAIAMRTDDHRPFRVFPHPGLEDLGYRMAARRESAVRQTAGVR